jgi:hypothetical protein
MQNLYLGRHPASLIWARAHGLPSDALIVEGNATTQQVHGNILWGVVPLPLAAEALRVHVIAFSGPPPRGAEYGIAEMEAAGAHWDTFTVRRGFIRPVCMGCLPPAVGARDGSLVCVAVHVACDCLHGESVWELAPI